MKLLSAPTSEAITIAAIQEKLTKLGWQFQERVFNDGDFRDAMIKISMRKGTQDLIHGDGVVGWGRFARIDAWEMANSFVDRWGTVEAYMAAGSPRREDW